MKKVAVLGSTGSIGTQTLDVIRANPQRLQVHSLVAFSNVEKLNSQVAEFAPAYHALISEKGEECLVEAVVGCDVAVVATRGIAALQCVLYCLDHGIDVALANKEVLVCAGGLVMPKVGKAKLIPVDSEHSAIMQCLSAGKAVDKILLTASGGPFFDLPEEELKNVTAQQALRHPNWNMGAKITVDSATMMNKALEVVEAHWLFGIPAEKIQIVVHRQSVVHSMVQYVSGSVVAQLALPDMHLPISLALLGQEVPAVQTLDFEKLSTLTFQACDKKFPCATLGHAILKMPPLCATAMNAANDVCVEKFLQGKMTFDRFYPVVWQTVLHFAPETENAELSVESVKRLDGLARKYAETLLA